MEQLRLDSGRYCHVGLPGTLIVYGTIIQFFCRTSRHCMALAVTLACTGQRCGRSSLVCGRSINQTSAPAVQRQPPRAVSYLSADFMAVIAPSRRGCVALAFCQASRQKYHHGRDGVMRRVVLRRAQPTTTTTSSSSSSSTVGL